MNRRILTIGFFFGFLAVTLFGCGGEVKKDDPLSNFKPNKAELGEDWKQFRHDAAQKTWVFDEKEFPTRPQEHRTAQGARVFWNGEVAAEELSLIDEGLTTMLTACKSPSNPWRADLFKYFLAPSDYKIIFVKSNYTLQEGETKGCAGLITGAHGDCGGGEGTCTAAGTVAGLIDRFNSTMPASQGGIYILIPKQTAEQLANPACKTLMKNAVRHEGEHVFFTQDTVLYFMYANDGAPGVGNHPYCRAE